MWSSMILILSLDIRRDMMQEILASEFWLLASLKYLHSFILLSRIMLLGAGRLLKYFRPGIQFSIFDRLKEEKT